ncbi:hypothetical protein FALCPG4_007033 [Fusarium falciforme]
MSSTSLRPHVILFFLVWATNVGFTVAATSTKQFKHWYPQYGRVFENIIKTNCTTEYDKYIIGYKNHSEIDWMAGGGIYTALTQPVVDCLLKNTSEFLKGNMTGAQILLGVMPTIIALLGPSHDEIAMLSNVGRRPLLAAGMALASPSAYFSRAFEYHEPDEILSKGKERRTQWRPQNVYSILLVSFLEYALVTAACYNVVMNTLQVSRQTITSFSSDTDFMPNLWLVLGLFIHVFSGIIFRLRLRGWRIKEPAEGKNTRLCCFLSVPIPLWDDVKKSKKEYEAMMEEAKKTVPGLKESFHRVIESLITWIKGTGPRLVVILTTTEFLPCATKGYRVDIYMFTETKTFLFLAWALSTFTILHVVFGTLVFAGILFVGMKDALSIVGRYIAAVVICRVILMYELAGIRECWGDKSRNDLGDDGRGKCATASSSSSSGHTSPHQGQGTQSGE